MGSGLGTMHWGTGLRRILLLHGISSNAAGWWRVGPDLAAMGWAVTAADLRGHGTSPIGDDYRLLSYADDVRSLGSSWDVVLGHSLGGAVALTAHAADAAWTGGLVLQDPVLLIPEDRLDGVAGQLMAPLEGPATEAEIAAENPRWHPTDVRLKQEALQQSSPGVVRATLEQNRPWNVIALAAGVEVPTFLLGSDPERGSVVPGTLGEWLATENPLIAYECLAGAGHSAHREQDTYGNYLAALEKALAWIDGRADANRT